MEEQTKEVYTMPAPSVDEESELKPTFVYVEKPLSLGYIIDNIDTEQLSYWLNIISLVMIIVTCIVYMILVFPTKYIHASAIAYE